MDLDADPMHYHRSNAFLFLYFLLDFKISSYVSLDVCNNVIHTDFVQFH